MNLLIAIAIEKTKNTNSMSDVNLFFSLYMEKNVIATNVKKSAINALYNKVCL